MNKQFIDTDKVYISFLSSYNLYIDSGKWFETVSKNQAIHVTHINSGDECYLVKLDIASFQTEHRRWSDIILKPANSSFFWPIDIVCADSYYLVFPSTTKPSVVSLKTAVDNSGFSGLESKHVKTIIFNVLEAFDSLHSHEYQYYTWSNDRIFVNERDYSLLIAFSDIVTKGFDAKVKISKRKYLSEYTDPYSYTNEDSYDCYSEMYALASIIFKLLIGRYPYEGSLMDGVPKESDNEYQFWLERYVSHPIFIFDKEDKRNSIGDFGHEIIFLKRWESLTDKMREMFCSIFSEKNIMRTNGSHISYTPDEWIDEIKRLDFKLK